MPETFVPKFEDGTPLEYRDWFLSPENITCRYVGVGTSAWPEDKGYYLIDWDGRAYYYGEDELVKYPTETQENIDKTIDELAEDIAATEDITPHEIANLIRLVNNRQRDFDCGEGEESQGGGAR